MFRFDTKKVLQVGTENAKYYAWSMKELKKTMAKPLVKILKKNRSELSSLVHFVQEKLVSKSNAILGALLLYKNKKQRNLRVTRRLEEKKKM